MPWFFFLPLSFARFLHVFLSLPVLVIPVCSSLSEPFFFFLGIGIVVSRPWASFSLFLSTSWAFSQPSWGRWRDGEVTGFCVLSFFFWRSCPCRAFVWFVFLHRPGSGPVFFLDSVPIVKPFRVRPHSHCRVPRQRRRSLSRSVAVVRPLFFGRCRAAAVVRPPSCSRCRAAAAVRSELPRSRELDGFAPARSFPSLLLFFPFREPARIWTSAETTKQWGGAERLCLTPNTWKTSRYRSQRAPTPFRRTKGGRAVTAALFVAHEPEGGCVCCALLYTGCTSGMSSAARACARTAGVQAGNHKRTARWSAEGERKVGKG